MAERSAASERKFLKIARTRFERAMQVESKNRAAALEDLKFMAGDQWPEDIRASRAGVNGQPGRPCLTINKIPTFVHQITNDQRQNRPAITVSPIGDKGDKKAAEMFRGLIREIERHSDAESAYDTGFACAAAMGWGYWRIITEYEDEDSFDQVIRVVRVRNPFTVYLDCDRQQPEGSDAMWGFVTEKIPRDEYEMRWPKADKLAWDAAGIGEDMKEWCDEKSIRIAEYFVVEVEMRRLVYLQSGHVGFYDDLHDTIKAQIAKDPSMILNERESECRKVHWYKITGKQILEDEPWAGKWIPIIECVGDEIDIEGKVIKSGIIRNAKDPQRMKNYWNSALTERVALDVKAPYIMEEGQMEGHEDEWRTANITPRSALTYKGTSVSGRPAPPPQRQPWGGPPAGVMAAEQGSEQDMMATTGIRFDATKSERIQDESGIALQHLKGNQSLGAYHYLDNFAKAKKFTGDIIVDLAPHIYDTKRILTIIREDGAEEQVQINPHQAKAFEEVKGEDKTIKSFNPKMGRYEVMITIGPSYETKRQEASNSMIQFMKVLPPQQASVISDLIAKNQDWHEADVVAHRLALTQPPGMLEPEATDMTPQLQAFVGSMKQQLQQLQQEKQQLLAALNEKNTEHMLEKDKIDKDFEAKMSNIEATMLAKMAEISSKREGQFLDHLEARIGQVMSMAQAQVPAQSPGGNGAAGD